MQPIEFPGSTEIKKPANMTDEECMSAWAFVHKDAEGKTTGFTTCWMPSYEDLKALNEGRGIFVHSPYLQLPAMSMMTLDENNNPNV